MHTWKRDQLLIDMSTNQSNSKTMTFSGFTNESLMEWEVPLVRRSEKDQPYKSGCETAGKVEKKLIREFLMEKMMMVKR